MRITLLDGFEFRCSDVVVDLSSGAQRLLAFLALHERPICRAFVAGTLWIDATDERAAANLRSTLWRLTPPVRSVVASHGNALALAPGVEVDLWEARATARRLIEDERNPTSEPAPLGPGGSSLALELLPDWYDDWVLLEREHQRQLRLHALEALCRRLTVAGHFGEAIDAGLAAIAAEPLRESAHRTLIRVHLAEGNYGEALRQYEGFRTLLDQELHLRPSPEMVRLVCDLLPANPQITV
jgi:DNA-binding SARP family transcriptional activator